jgi:hypothetical protein
MSRSQLIDEMRVIHEALNSLPSITQNTLIDTASVPVIKLKINLAELGEIDDEEISILNVDITLDEPK